MTKVLLKNKPTSFEEGQAILVKIIQENIGLAIIAIATIIVLTMEWWYV